ncbi:NAD(P)H-dependent oxidoreductase [Rhodovulum sp. DZ06]|uniref:NAD(P)H-dependent oxidoreductase n=1 Tax=Rhodovulum sp. DZ06 TaxID=3425126 RepID=UPI003D33FA08
MRALVIHCHPAPDSYAAAVRDTVLNRLAAGGAETRLVDLYADGFRPAMTPAEWACYDRCPDNVEPIADHAAALRWADALIFTYPTWWYGQPAMLKGWLERVLIPEVAFTSPSAGPIRPGLTHIRSLGVFTTCGASRKLTWWVGSPGKRTLTRGLRMILHPAARTFFAAHYDMDASTPESRARHLAKVAAQVDRMTRKAPASAPLPEPGIAIPA